MKVIDKHEKGKYMIINLKYFGIAIMRFKHNIKTNTWKVEDENHKGIFVSVGKIAIGIGKNKRK